MKQLIVITGLLMWFISEMKKPLLREQQRQFIKEVIHEEFSKSINYDFLEMYLRGRRRS